MFSLPSEPRSRPTVIPSIRKRKDSSMSLMNGIVTRRCCVIGGKWLIVLKYWGPSRRVWRQPWRISRWRRIVVVELVGEWLVLEDRGERKA